MTTGRLVNNRGAVQFSPSPENTSLDNARLSNAGVPQFCRRLGKRPLFRFSSFVLVRFVDGSPYRPKKRVGARRDVHIA